MENATKGYTFRVRSTLNERERDVVVKGGLLPYTRERSVITSYSIHYTKLYEVLLPGGMVNFQITGMSLFLLLKTWICQVRSSQSMV